MRESGSAHDREERIQVRWGLHEDEAQIAELLELNGMGRTLVSEERFVVAAAKPGGKVLAALRYRTQPKRLLLGLLVSDPWAQERPLAVALYAGAGELAREIGAREVLARSVLHGEDYPTKPGTAGDTRVGGIWTRRGRSAAAKSCQRADGGGWSRCWEFPPCRSLGPSAEPGHGRRGRGDRGRHDAPPPRVRPMNRRLDL